jgi:hypothetical protein
LVLISDACFVDAAAAVWTTWGHRGLVELVHRRRHRPLPVATMGRARLPAGSFRPCGGSAFRERRRLASARAPRRVEFVFQTVVFPSQAVTLAHQLRALPLQLRTHTLQVGDLVPQPRNLAILIPRARRRLRRMRRSISGRGQALVMPDSHTLYKYEILDRSLPR